GCFSSSEPLEDEGYYTYQTTGNCQPICVGLGFPVMGLVNGSNCYCGDLLPAKSSQVDDDKCDTPCNGYDTQTCGGDNYWQVYLTGLNNNDVDYYSGSSSSTTIAASSSTITSAGTPIVVTVGGTVIVTKGSDPTSSSSSSSNSSSPNKAGIAAGVVVGVVAIAGIVGGVFLYLRHRRRKAVEEEYRQRQNVNSFVGAKGKTAASSVNDTVLDPEYVRRMSHGSIADNQDYSRRILQVS
ncbi:hypothetical protein K490DRAFT_21335, partial [Saccharata proteae CBS 121410]